MNYLLNLFIEFLDKHNFNESIGIMIFSILPFAIAAALVFVVLMLVYAERKILAYMTQRKGPNRVGPNGILQTTADAIKLLCKENIELLHSDKVIFTIAPILAFSSIVVLWCIIPYNAEFHLIDSTISLLFYVAVAGFPMLFHFLAGYASNNKYSLLGSYRALSLTASYSVPILFTLLATIFLADSMDLHKIIIAQEKVWFIIPNIIGFIVFFIASIAELNRCPFDLSEAESELVSGYHTEYSGMRFAMFFLGEYAALFVTAVFTAIIFFGGYQPPFGVYLSNILMGNCRCFNFLIYFEQTFWLIAKSSIIIFLIIWIRGTLPRLTQKSVMNLFWRYLTPISIINLILIILATRG